MNSDGWMMLRRSSTTIPSASAISRSYTLANRLTSSAATFDSSTVSMLAATTNTPSLSSSAFSSAKPTNCRRRRVASVTDPEQDNLGLGIKASQQVSVLPTRLTTRREGITYPSFPDAFKSSFSSDNVAG